MATVHQISPVNRVKIIDPNRHPLDAVSTDSLGTPGNYTDTAALETRLIALGYTTQKLSGMTLNDKHYALKQFDDPTIGY